MSIGLHLGRFAFWIQRRQWHPTPVLLPEKSHGQRSLVGCSPWCLKELDMTEWLHFHFSLSCIGEGNGNPLQCSCLENPRDGGALWAAVYGVTQSRTRLKRLSLGVSINTNLSKTWTECLPKSLTLPISLSESMRWPHRRQAFKTMSSRTFPFSTCRTMELGMDSAHENVIPSLYQALQSGLCTVTVWKRLYCLERLLSLSL